MKRQRRPFAGELKSGIPPTGIIRTLPYGAHSSEEALRHAYHKLMRGLQRLNREDSYYVLLGMSAQPRLDVLHCYLIIEGKVIGRARIAGYETNLRTVRCWDDTTRTYKVWAILSAPYEPAPETILRRGFQGFRYTVELW
jgi:hypothetical protein